jgi:hypothetical protein
MSGLMSMFSGGMTQSSSAQSGTGDQDSGLHITTGGSGDQSGSTQLVWIAAIGAAAFAIYAIARK